MYSPLILARTGNDEMAVGTIAAFMAAGCLAASIMLTVMKQPQRKLSMMYVGSFMCLVGITLFGMGRKIDGVANAYGSSYMGNIPATSSRTGIDHINIVSYDDTLLDYAKGNIAQGTLNEVYGDSNKVATVFNKNNSLKVGDTIQIAGTEVEISCALSQGLFGDDLIVICSQETFERLMGQEKYGLIGVQLEKDAINETVAQIRRLENDDIVITDQRESNRTNNTSYWASRIVCYGFLAIIAVITLFNIINSTGVSPQGQGTPERFAEYAAPCSHTVQSAGKGHPG